MTKYEFDPKLVRKAIQGFLNLAHKHRGFRFNINEFTIIPKVVIVCEVSGCFLLDAFSKYIENVEGVIFDVLGLHKKYATQVELYRNGIVVVSPGLNRPKEKINDLLKALSQEG